VIPKTPTLQKHTAHTVKPHKRPAASREQNCVQSKTTTGHRQLSATFFMSTGTAEERSGNGERGTQRSTRSDRPQPRVLQIRSGWLITHATPAARPRGARVGGERQKGGGARGAVTLPCRTASTYAFSAANTCRDAALGRLGRGPHTLWSGVQGTNEQGSAPLGPPAASPRSTRPPSYCTPAARTCPAAPSSPNCPPRP
jgi:hypothetical protein